MFWNRFKQNKTSVVIQPIAEKRFVQLGEAVLVDAMQVTAMYEKHGDLVIRVSGVGLIEIGRKKLYWDYKKCVQLISAAVK